jgi:hypothetical protein
MEETKAINLSLMSLKECIRARTMAGLGDGVTQVHVPYRRSKVWVWCGVVWWGAMTCGGVWQKRVET